MITIYKYQIEIDSIAAKVQMPKDAKILTVQNHRGLIYIWAEVDTENEEETVTFEVFGTGHPIHTDIGIDREYIGTVQIDFGNLVMHVYKYTGV